MLSDGPKRCSTPTMPLTHDRTCLECVFHLKSSLSVTPSILMQLHCVTGASLRRSEIEGRFTERTLGEMIKQKHLAALIDSLCD